MKSVFVIVAAIMIVGCSSKQIQKDNEGRIVQDLTEVCINEVVYYKSYVHGGPTFTPKFKPDSTVETCN